LRRSPWSWVGLALLLAIGTFLLGAFWVFGTTAGGRWLLEALSRRTSYRIAIEEAAGRLAGGFRVDDVTVRWEGGIARIDTFYLDMRPVPLLAGRVAIEVLVLEDADVHLQERGEEEAPAGFSWPGVSGPAGRVRVDVASLRLFKLAVRRPGEDPVAVERLTTGLSWRGGVLAVTDLTAKLPSAVLTGRVEAGFIRPSLDLDLEAGGIREPPFVDRVSIEVHMTPEEGPVLMKGPVRIAASAGEEGIAEFTGDLSLARDRAVLRRFVLTRPDRPGTVSGEAAAAFTDEGVLLDLGARIADLDLSDMVGIPTDISGTLDFEGTPGDYRGRISLANEAEGWRAVRLSSPFTGSLQGIVLPQLSGAWLGGDLGGRLEASWADGLALKGAFRGKGLDPERITPEWPGRINFDLDVAVRRPEDAPLVAEVKGRFPRSVLRGRPLTGEIDATLRGEAVRIARLELHGDGFDVSARGELRERIAFEADIRNLSGLVPQAQGRLAARGWFQWRNRSLAGSLTAQGRDVAAGGSRAGELSLAASRVRADGPFRIEADARELVYGRLEADAASLRASGTPASHEGRLSLRWPDGGMQAAAAGGYEEETWTGTVTDLSVRETAAGLWRLAAPADAAVSRKALKLPSFVFVGEQEGERLRVDADLSLDPTRGIVTAEWRSLDLSIANLWIEEVKIFGRTSGTAAFRRPSEDRLELSGRFDASGQLVQEGRAIPVRRAEAEFRWDGEGLRAAWDLHPGEEGLFRGSLSSDRPARLAIPDRGEIDAEWRFPDLALLSPWLPGSRIAGMSSGNVQGRWGDARRLNRLAGEIHLAGTVAYKELELAVREADADVAWDEEGLRAAWELQLDDGGRFAGRLRSETPAGRLRMPEQGQVEATLSEVDLALVRPWLPESVILGGRLSGQAGGELLPGDRLQLSGEAHIDNGALQWRTEEGSVSASVRTADLDATWRDEALRGSVALVLEDYGLAKGSFQVPLPARLPPSLDPDGPVKAVLDATLQEKGLLPAFFPGLVQETAGKAEIRLVVGGTWSDPDIGGTVGLSEAGAYLPAAGIRLQDLSLQAQVSDDRIRIESFEVGSGQGRLQGNATVRLRDWAVEGYEASLKGERFQTINLPELQMATNPDLTLEGTKQLLQVRGEVNIPELLIYGRAEPPIAPSPDVVLVDAPPEPPGEGFPLTLDVQVRIILGDRVLVRAEGIDARLDGSIILTGRGEPDDLAAQGRVNVVQGIYSTYGVRLRITRGSVFFAGGPLSRPTLDILALRQVREVEAGVQVTGTPQDPKVALYSRPEMPDTDVLSYIVLGRPLTGDAEEADLLMRAATALLARGESAVLQDRLKRGLGLDVLEVEPAVGEEVTGAMITVGKYLSPRLYISYGRALFSGVDEVRLRYDISRRFEIESRMGEEGGIDLFYKIEFH
jgi:translocation and assembly module TamB